MTTHAQRRALGDYGERLAVRHLQTRGLQVLERNWRCADGEIDIVARDGDTVVICEVKTRSSERFGSPLEAITPAKAFRLHRLGWRWVRANALPSGVTIRVDVVCILLSHRPPSIEHLVGVV
jgi:putative endonuclease